MGPGPRSRWPCAHGAFNAGSMEPSHISPHQMPRSQFGPASLAGSQHPIGNLKSMGHMVPAGWAVHTVPAGLVQTAPSMLGPWNHPTSHLIKCRGLNIEGAVRARRLILNCPRRAAPRARVCHQSVRKSFVRDCSLHVSPRPVVPSSALRGRFGSRVPRALTPCDRQGRLLLRPTRSVLSPPHGRLR